MSTSSAALGGTRRATEVVQQVAVAQATNGVCYASAGEVSLPSADLERMVAAVPSTIAAALKRKAYYFVPLAIAEGDDTLVADRYDVGLSDRASCHRNVNQGSAQCVFISTRLMEDRFSIAFEFYINVGHAFVEQAGVSEEFAELVWKQVEANVRGETSLDAHELRQKSVARNTGHPGMHVVDEKAKTGYFNAAFSDAIAIYMLALYLDVDYWDLRERDYPLLAPAALAERLKKIAQLFPPNPGFDFNIFYRRKT
jgi:hypothetical protein